MSDPSGDPSTEVPVSDTTDASVDEAAAAPMDAAPVTAPLDLDAIERDLADVELALARLDSGEYWRDEVTGAEIPDEVLAARPTSRRADA